MKTERFAGSLLAGAGLMYLLDPERGARRRALLRDRFVHAWDDLTDAAGTTGRDVRNRARGLFAEARALASFEHELVPDPVLVERVRSKIGRVTSHPGAIDVAASDGRVTLAGPILADEADRLIACVGKIRGVTAVENRLETHKRAGTVPALQGSGTRREPRVEFAQENWSPTARLLAGAAGGGLAAYGAKTRGPFGVAAAAAGTALVARAVTNLPVKRFFGLGPGRRGIDVRKAIHVDAPVDRVFDYWGNLSSFPFFMDHVKDVRDNGEGVTHWKVEGPAGVAIEFDAGITALVPNQLIAWKTLPGEAVRHAGIVRFDEDPRGTRVDVRMTYRPPAGVIGHAVAALFGADPGKALDDDLLRFKSLIETGKTTAHGEEVVAVEIPEEPATATLGPESLGEGEEIAEPAPTPARRGSRKRPGTPAGRPSARPPELG